MSNVSQVDSEVTYFVQSFEYGLIAAWQQIRNSSLYYVFDGDGLVTNFNVQLMLTLLILILYRSVRSVIDESGYVLNSYDYDPFGKLLQRTERVHNIFKYLGSLGIIKHEELMDMYSMRDRVYDASHGRFISIDPLGK